MAEIDETAPAQPDLVAHAQLHHSVTQMILAALEGLMQTMPAAAGIRATVDRARQMLDRADTFIKTEVEPAVPPPVGEAPSSFKPAKTAP